MKLISICPSNTELLAYLGMIDHLIAVDDFSDWPESLTPYHVLVLTYQLIWISSNHLNLI